MSDQRKLLFVQMADECSAEHMQRVSDYLNELSNEYQFVVFGCNVNLLTPEAACYSLTETLDSYSYTITAKTPKELLELREAIKAKKSEEQPKRGREFF